jgi:hypothetical protein
MAGSVDGQVRLTGFIIADDWFQAKSSTVRLSSRDPLLTVGPSNCRRQSRHWRLIGGDLSLRGLGFAAQGVGRHPQFLAALKI